MIPVIPAPFFTYSNKELTFDNSLYSFYSNASLSSLRVIKIEADMFLKLFYTHHAETPELIHYNFFTLSTRYKTLNSAL